MGYKNAELRLGKNDTPLDDPRAGEVALRIDSTGAIYTKSEGVEEVSVGGKPYQEIVVKMVLSSSPSMVVYQNDTAATFSATRQGTGSFRLQSDIPVFTANTHVSWGYRLGNFGFVSNDLLVGDTNSEYLPLRALDRYAGTETDAGVLVNMIVRIYPV